MKLNSGKTITPKVLAAAMALALSASPVLAQDNTTGSLKGTISSQSGAELADVVITLRHLKQGFSRTVQTNSKGEYVLRALPVGDYSISVTQAGKPVIDGETISISLGQAVTYAPVLSSSDSIEKIAIMG